MRTRIFGLLVLLSISNMESCASPAILLISIPKCGTHLMGLVLGILTGQQHRTPGIKVINYFDQIVKDTLNLIKQHTA